MIRSLILAGGCFWCVENDLREAPGVVSVTSGYSGGESTDPTYEDHRGHREVVLVEYDDTTTSYKTLLQFFIDHIDPTDTGGQFADRGESYRTAIYYETEEEKNIAEGVLEELDRSGVYEQSHAVDLLPRKQFYQAEEYHQKYAEKNPSHYATYRTGSGREEFVNRTCQIREEKHIIWSK
ncbi:MAG: peptide-methionine (S)-S-oxide reductase MsrA [Candidatus Parcubacteria bacterium]|jgi:methionine-S-sulfoxide reductase